MLYLKLALHILQDVADAHSLENIGEQPYHAANHTPLHHENALALTSLCSDERWSNLSINLRLSNQPKHLVIVGSNGNLNMRATQR
jgi:hypothetical protein